MRLDASRDRTSGLSSSVGGQAANNEAIGLDFILNSMPDSCEGGKGSKVWVYFANFSAQNGVVIGPVAHMSRYINKWGFDSFPGSTPTPETLETTAQTTYFDYPALQPQSNSEWRFTLLVGIACRCKSKPNLFKAKLLDAGTLAISISSHEAKAQYRPPYNLGNRPDSDVVVAFPNQVWSDVTMPDLNNGGWLNIMNSSLGSSASIWV